MLRAAVEFYHKEVRPVKFSLTYERELKGQQTCKCLYLIFAVAKFNSVAMMKRKYLLAAFALSIIISVNAVLLNKPQQEPAFKNLKVLPKDIGKPQLDSIMQLYCVSLGVRCGFCHARNADTTLKNIDFASDQKFEKDVARSMVKMTAYLNTNYFNFEESANPDTIHAVICYTCHRGKTEPDSRAFLGIIDSTIKSQHKNSGNR